MARLDMRRSVRDDLIHDDTHGAAQTRRGLPKVLAIPSARRGFRPTGHTAQRGLRVAHRSHFHKLVVVFTLIWGVHRAKLDSSFYDVNREDFGTCKRTAHGGAR